MGELSRTFWPRIRGNNVAFTKDKENGNGKPTSMCSKWDKCSFQHDGNKRAKAPIPPAPAPEPSTQPQDVKNSARSKSPRSRSPSGRISRLSCKHHLEGTCTNPFCEKLHSQQCLFYKTKEGWKFGETCSFANRRVEEQPSKSSKKKGNISALAFSKETRQLSCAFLDMELPRSSSILRKSSTMPKPIRCVRFTKAVLRNSSDRDRNPSLNRIYLGDPHQRNPNAPNFEDRSQEGTEWQEHWARKPALKLAKKILKLKDEHKSTFFSPTEKWCLPSPSKNQTGGKRIYWTSRCPTTVTTDNGEVQTHEEATVYVKELDIFFTVKLLEDTPAVLSRGKLREDHWYSYEWTNGQQPCLINNGTRI